MGERAQMALYVCLLIIGVVVNFGPLGELGLLATYSEDKVRAASPARAPRPSAASCHRRTAVARCSRARPDPPRPSPHPRLAPPCLSASARPPPPPGPAAPPPPTPRSRHPLRPRWRRPRTGRTPTRAMARTRAAAARDSARPSRGSCFSWARSTACVRRAAAFSPWNSIFSARRLVYCSRPRLPLPTVAQTAWRASMRAALRSAARAWRSSRKSWVCSRWFLLRPPATANSRRCPHRHRMRRCKLDAAPRAASRFDANLREVGGRTPTHVPRIYSPPGWRVELTLLYKCCCTVRYSRALCCSAL